MNHLLLSMSLFVAAIYFHALAQSQVIKTIKRQWHERLFISRRATADNLTEEGIRYRRQSNVCAIFGALAMAAYVYLRNAG